MGRKWTREDVQVFSEVYNGKRGTVEVVQFDLCHKETGEVIRMLNVEERLENGKPGRRFGTTPTLWRELLRSVADAVGLESFCGSSGNPSN